MTIDPKSTISGRMSKAAKRRTVKVVIDVHFPAMEQVTLEYSVMVPPTERMLMEGRRKAALKHFRNYELLKASIVSREG